MTKIHVSTTKELLRLYAEGVISPDEWQGLIEGATAPPLPDDILHLSLADYADAINSFEDWDIVAIVWRGLGGTIDERTPPLEFLRYAHAVSDGLKKVAGLFEALPSPPMSAAEVRAGFGNLRFGIAGIIDKLARRQGVDDEIVKKWTLNQVLGKLQMDGQVAICEKKFHKIISNGS